MQEVNGGYQGLVEEVRLLEEREREQQPQVALSDEERKNREKTDRKARIEAAQRNYLR